MDSSYVCIFLVNFKKFGLGLYYEIDFKMKTTLRNILIIFGVLVLLACAWYFRSIVVYILVSGVFSIMGRPLVDLFCRIRIRNWSLSSCTKCSYYPFDHMGNYSIVFCYFHSACYHADKLFIDY